MKYNGPARRLVVGAIVTLLSAATLAVPAASVAESPSPRSATFETVFNNPGEDGAKDFRIEERLVDLINGTPAGERIDASIYSFTRPNVATAFKEAQARGVKVSLAIDGGTDNAENKEVVDLLKGANLTKLVFCKGSGKNTACIGNRSDYGINHNKLMTFSKSGDLANVVVVSSYNLTNTQGSLFNNAVVMSGDADLYDFYLGHVGKALAQQRDNNYFNNGGYFKSDASLVTSYLSPRADSGGGTSQEHSTDTWAQVLKYVEKSSGCTLQVAQASITNSRTPVVDELVRIAKLGCKVTVVYDSMGSSALSALQGTANVEMKRYLDREGNTDPELKVSLHHKYMIFSGTYNGKADRQIVFTGSHNVTSPALRNNDEILIKVEQASVASAFKDNFTTVWDRAICANPTSEEGPCP